MNINEMTYEQFMELPRKDWDKEVMCDGFVIVPHKIHKSNLFKYNILNFLNKTFPGIFRKPEIYEVDGMHDSGYRLFSLVLCKGEEPICIGNGGDVLHLDGIGGFGYDWLKRFGKCPTEIPVSGWTMDCLPNTSFLECGVMDILLWEETCLL